DGSNQNWLNQIYNGTPLDLGMRVSGVPLEPGSFGVAARTIISGSPFGLPAMTQDSITGGDGQASIAPYNFLTPPGWAMARGTVIQNGLEAGAYSSTSGPCN